MRTALHAPSKRRPARLPALVLCTALFLLNWPAPSLAQPRTFVATGRAKLSRSLETAQRRALENALWLAVEQAVQMLVPPDALTQHRQSIASVLAHPRRQVTSYQVITRGPSRGYFVVQVRAVVAVNGLASRLQALAVPVNRQAAAAPSARPTVQGLAVASAAPESGGSVPPPQSPTPQPRAASPAQAPRNEATAQAQPAPGRPRIALLPFQLGFTNPQWTQNWDVSLGVTELVEEALFNTRQYRLVERRQLEQVLREQGIGASGTIDPATAARAGRVLGVRCFVAGSVNQFDLKGAGGVSFPVVLVGLYQAQVQLTARIVDTTSAEIVAIVRSSGRSEGVLAIAQIQNVTFGGAEFRNSVLGKALDQAVAELVTKLGSTLGHEHCGNR